MQDQFQMFSKILNDKHYDDNERLTIFSTYATNNQQNYQRHQEYQTDFNSRRMSRAIEDTGSIISDYTEDDIDVPDDDDHYIEHNQNIFTPMNGNINNNNNKHTANTVAPSTASLPNTTQNNRQSSGQKRSQRQSASLTRNGDKREKKRRTRSNDVKYFFKYF